VMPSSTLTVLLLAVPTLARFGLDSPSVVLVLVRFTALAGGLAALLSPVVFARLMSDDHDDEVCICCTEKEQTYILLQFMILLMDQRSRFFKSSGQSELLGHFDCMILA
jgi:hypothetical protein